MWLPALQGISLQPAPKRQLQITDFFLDFLQGDIGIACRHPARRRQYVSPLVRGSIAEAQIDIGFDPASEESQTASAHAGNPSGPSPTAASVRVFAEG
jgi:hypothetical protein